VSFPQAVDIPNTGLAAEYNLHWCIDDADIVAVAVVVVVETAASVAAASDAAAVGAVDAADVVDTVVAETDSEDAESVHTEGDILGMSGILGLRLSLHCGRQVGRERIQVSPQKLGWGRLAIGHSGLRRRHCWRSCPS